MSPCTYKIRWSTEHDSGELPYEFVGMEAALKAGQGWAADMERLNGIASAVNKNLFPIHNGKHYIATPEYQWEVIRVDPPIPQNPT
jgi:hypothetical protein